MLTSLAALISFGGLGACVHSAVYTSRVEKTYPAAGQLVDVGGADVHVLKMGDAGPPVLMIHGASANAREFETTLAPRLADTHRVFMADRPGHGHSERLGHAETLAVQAAQMAGALESLAPGEKAIVVGHSFGGGVALRLALDHPDQVEALVLLAPVSHDWGGGGGAWYNKYAGPPVLGHIFTQLVPILGPASVEGGINGVFHPLPAPEDYLETSGVKLVFRPSNFRANARDVNALREELMAQETRYGELDMPIVIYSGSQDTVLKPQLHAAQLEKDAPDVTLIRLPETGHMPHHAHGADIAAMIRRLSLGESVQAELLIE